MSWNRQRSYALGITLCVVVAVIVVAITTDPFGLSPFKEKTGRSPGAGKDAYRVGSIIFETDPTRCEEIKFDNLTGHFSESQPCDSAVGGVGGEPAPIGTFNRLESIRRSFVGQAGSASAPGN